MAEETTERQFTCPVCKTLMKHCKGNKDLEKEGLNSEAFWECPFCELRAYYLMLTHEQVRGITKKGHITWLNQQKAQGTIRALLQVVWQLHQKSRRARQILAAING